MFSFDKTKVNFGSMLGSGSFGSVYEYKYDERWAVKVAVTQNIETLKSYIQEIVIGFSLNHPCVLPVRGYGLEYSMHNRVWNVYLKMPRMQTSLGSLLDKQRLEHNFLEEHTIVKYFYQIASGLEYLHSRSIAHRDIKPANILIDRNGQLRIADIGLGKFIDEDSSYFLTEVAGTRFYTAPEILMGASGLKKRDLFKADIWSLGIVMLELCTLEFKRIDLFSSKQEIKDRIERSLNNLKGKYNQTLIDLISNLLQYDPSERKTAKEIRTILENSYANLLRGRTDDGRTCSMGTSMETPQEPNQKISFQKSFEELSKKWHDFFSIKMKDEKLQIAAENQKIDDELTKNLIKDISQYQKDSQRFQDIFFSFMNCTKISTEGFMNLAKALESDFKYTEILDLNFEGCKGITDQSIEDLAIKIGENLKNIKHLSLDFSFCHQVTDRAIKEIANLIEHNLINIEVLRLDFESCHEISNEAILEMLNKIKNLNKLQQLNLNFAGCVKIADEAVIALANQLKNLKNFSLVLSCCEEITDQSIIELIKSIGLNCRNIQNLTLNLYNCEKVTNKSLEEFAQQLENGLVYLEHLTLNFSYCQKLTDDGVKKLVTQIGSSLTNIQYLDLNFSFCRQITDKALREIALQFEKHFTKLEFLDLNLSYCKEITDQAVKELGTIIQKEFKKLNNLFLNFSSYFLCKQVSQQNKDFLRNSFKHLHSMKVL